jgi:hypothetical protein
MTWYANEIVLRASPRAVDVISASAQLAPFSYLIGSLAGHEWHRPEIQHGLPPEGLLVVRPVCGGSSHGVSWYGTPALDWAELLPHDANADSMLDKEVSQKLSPYLDDDSLPPQSFREALTSLALSVDETVIYYDCGMWGGDVDYEYCLAYEPAESLFVTNLDLPPDSPGAEGSLRAGLMRLGLSLPTPYFAPHVRSFPWETYKLR